MSSIILKITELLNSFLYIKIFNIPFIIIWVIATGIFCTVQFRFTNFRLFKHGIQTLLNLKCNNDNGIITHIQAFATVISGTVGLGTISGVAIAVTIGGPSAIFWMIITGMLGMSIKFAEVVLAFTYRSENSTGGAFYYMEHGLAKIGFIKTGKFLAFIYAIMLLIAMILGGIPFQVNQIAALSNDLFEYNNTSIIISLLVLIVILGGIKRIAFVSTGLAPVMIMLYIGTCVYLIYVNGNNLLNALSIIFEDIFNKSAIGGGVLSGLIAGVRRSVFANEAGTGTAAIVHSVVKEKDRIKVGSVAMITPFVDTILISFLTGIVIIITGMHSTNKIGDITLVSSIFSMALPLFSKIVLPLIMFSFAFSTIIAYYYYCEVALLYLFGNKKVLILFQVFIVVSVYISCISKNIEFISYLGDSLFMSLMVPNAIAIYLLRKEVLNTIHSYYHSKRY